MKVLYSVTDAELGGAERLLATLARHSNPRDELVLVVLMSEGAMSAELEAEFDRVIYLRFPPTSRNLPAMVRALDRVVVAENPDVVSSHLFHSDLVVALSRRRSPRTTTVHTHGFGAQDHPLTKVIARAVGMLSRRFDAVIPTSDSPDMAAFLKQYGYRGVVPAIRNTADMPAQPAFDPAHRRFVTLARSHPVKGYPVLFEAFASIAEAAPDWSLHSYGSGVSLDEPSMAQALARPGVRPLVDSGRIRLHGATSEPESVLRGAGALVISSLYGETFPLVGVEAAGAGVPVITTDVGSCNEFADDATYVVPAGEVGALAGALRAYATADDTHRELLSEAARQRAEREYSPARMAESYRRVYEGVVG